MGSQRSDTKPSAIGRRSTTTVPALWPPARLRPWHLALLLALLTLVAFLPAIGCGFVNVDDGAYVWNNPLLKQGFTLENIAAAWNQRVLFMWSPLSTFSFLLDYQLFNPRQAAPDPITLDATGFHLLNVVYHAAAVVVLFVLLYRMTGAWWRSALAAALFGVHPLRVESVAWVAERKDVLALLCGLLALWAYTAYARKGNWRWYGAMVALAALSLMAKPMFVTLPFLLLLLDYWPLQRWRALRSAALPDNPAFRPRAWWVLLLEKLPLLLLAAWCIHVLAYGNVTAMLAGPTLTGADVPAVVAPPTLAVRLANVPIAYVRYLGKMFWFGHLAAFYPLEHWPAWAVAAASVLLLLLTVAVAFQWRQRPWLLVGWLWFLGTMVPMIGLVQTGGFGMADRYTYFPSIGLMILVAWTVPGTVAPHAARRWIPGAACGAVLLVLVVCTGVQIGYWKDSVSLFARAVAVTAPNDFSYTGLGKAQMDAGDYPGALASFRQALALRPDDVRIHLGVIKALDALGRFDEGEQQVRAALAGIPEYLPAAAPTGPVLDATVPGVHPETMRAQVLAAARAIQGRDHFDRGRALESQADHNGGNHAAAIAQYRQAVQRMPGYASAHYNLANCLLADQDYPGAIVEYREVIRLLPDKPESHFNLAIALEATQQHAAALAEAGRVRQLNPALYGHLPPSLLEPRP